MKNLALIALATPMVLVAQTPATQALGDQVQAKYKQTTTETNALLATYDYEGAIAKARAFAETPGFPYPSTTVEALSADAKLVNEHVGKAQEVLMANASMLNGYLLLASTLRNAGQWEQAVETFEAAIARSNKNLSDFRNSVSPIAMMWEKLDAEGKAFIAEHEESSKATEAALNQDKVRLEAIWADHNSKKKKLSKKEVEALNAETAAWGERAKAFSEISQKLAFHKGNMGRLEGIQKFLLEREKAGDYSDILKKNADTIRKEIATQKEEIEKFNTEQTAKAKAKLKSKAKPVEGNKPWIDALLSNKDFVSAIGSPSKQMSLINRTLVLDPGNEKATAIANNIKAGKDAYFVEPRAKKSARKGKK